MSEQRERMIDAAEAALRASWEKDEFEPDDPDFARDPWPDSEGLRDPDLRRLAEIAIDAALGVLAPNG